MKPPGINKGLDGRYSFFRWNRSFENVRNILKSVMNVMTLDYILFDSLYWAQNPKSINNKTQICP